MRFRNQSQDWLFNMKTEPDKTAESGGPSLGYYPLRGCDKRITSYRPATSWNDFKVALRNIVRPCLKINRLIKGGVL